MTEVGGKSGRKEKKCFHESHRKQHGGRKGERINPLTVQRHASTGPGRMNPPVQWPGSNCSIGELLLLINEGGFNR